MNYSYEISLLDENYNGLNIGLQSFIDGIKTKCTEIKEDFLNFYRCIRETIIEEIMFSMCEDGFEPEFLPDIDELSAIKKAIQLYIE